MLHLDRETQIEDPRTHPAAVVAALRDLLAGGTDATPDPKRAGFYEIESASRVFYIHISPVTGKVLLLATWPAENSCGGRSSDSLAAA